MVKGNKERWSAETSTTARLVPSSTVDGKVERSATADWLFPLTSQYLSEAVPRPLQSIHCWILADRRKEGCQNSRGRLRQPSSMRKKARSKINDKKQNIIYFCNRKAVAIQIVYNLDPRESGCDLLRRNHTDRMRFSGELL